MVCLSHEPDYFSTKWNTSVPNIPSFHCSIDDVQQTDLIVVACIANFEKTIRCGAKALEWRRYHYGQSAEIASVCTGGFFLAATGLLDGKTATTHWGLVEPFKRMFPKVHLKPERLITDEEALYCSGALYSSVDLSIYLVEKYCGHPRIRINFSTSILLRKDGAPGRRRKRRR